MIHMLQCVFDNLIYYSEYVKNMFTYLGHIHSLDIKFVIPLSKLTKIHPYFDKTTVTALLLVVKMATTRRK